MPAPPVTLSTMPLYPTEARIALELFGEEVKAAERRARWQVIVATDPHLPPVDPLFGGRFWPAVVAHLEVRAGLRRPEDAATIDGPENFDAQRNDRRTPRPRPHEHQEDAGRASEAVLAFEPRRPGRGLPAGSGAPPREP